MLSKKWLSLSCLILAHGMLSPHAHARENGNFSHPFYVGLTGGYGSTVWEGLVPNKDKQNLALALSTPIHVDEGGGVWGLFAGYELSRYFALETAYMHYPNVKVFFDTMSLFAFDHDGETDFTTRTETISLIGKVMMMIPCTEIRAYSGAGAAAIHRSDKIIQRWRVRPTFSVGFNYNFTEHIMGELAGTYVAGYGESELNPTDNYMPFLYSAFFRLSYRFG